MFWRYEKLKIQLVEYGDRFVQEGEREAMGCSIPDWLRWLQ
jgi:hypothetical protein